MSRLVAVEEGKLLWTPSEMRKKESNINGYMRWLQEKMGKSFNSYHALWDWSVTDTSGFWASIWDYFHIHSAKPYAEVIGRRGMPNDRWFDGAVLNYAEHVFRQKKMNATHPAILFKNESGRTESMTWQQLYEQVACVAHALREMGVKQGDRIAAYLPNIPQTIVSFLATASLGAIWSSCSPDFGTASVIDRFKQIEPKVLFAVDGYHYNGKSYDKRSVITELEQQLPTLEHIVFVPYAFPERASSSHSNSYLWSELLHMNAPPFTYEPVPFDHPLWILYSSGTTGLPKPIVHGHGGILLEHLKMLHLQLDLKPGDRFFWMTTTGWMMWNLLTSGLLVGATVLLYDGSPAYPKLDALWAFAEETKMTLFGTSAAYLTTCLKGGLTPNRRFSLEALKTIGSTGSPLPPEGFGWVYTAVDEDIWLTSISGGTDVCTAFVGGSPTLPVRAGEIQCRMLGAKVEAFNEAGSAVIDEVGELVVTEPMPSMPLYFWNDKNNERYLSSYFDMFPNVWRHGDWIKVSPDGSVTIFGRSDSTINRMGIRIGTSEIYRTVEDIDFIKESLVFDVERGEKSVVLLFVVLQGAHTMDENETRSFIKQKIRHNLSPRHVPDEIFYVHDIPKTLNGKKMEVPIKRIFNGIPVEKAVNVDSMNNPHILDHYVQLAQEFNESIGDTLNPPR